MPINRATPAYPVEEIVRITNCTMLARMCSVTVPKYNWPRQPLGAALRHPRREGYKLDKERAFTLAESPAVPLTLEGASMLHQVFRFNWKAWRALSAAEQQRISTAATSKLRALANPPAPSQTALFSLLGHKGDLMLIHTRESIEALNRVELQLAQTELYDFLDLTYSYLSVVELGLYESTAKTYSSLAAQNIEPHTPAWNAGIKETIDRQSAAMASRLYPSIPEATYACFYPMDRKRGEAVNWYTETMADRQRMMHLHGHDRPPLRRPGPADHFRLDRPRRLGVGRRPLRQRPRRLQETHLRNALRRSQR